MCDTANRGSDDILPWPLTSELFSYCFSKKITYKMKTICQPLTEPYVTKYRNWFCKLSKSGHIWPLTFDLQSNNWWQCARVYSLQTQFIKHMHLHTVFNSFITVMCLNCLLWNYDNYRLSSVSDRNAKNITTLSLSSKLWETHSPSRASKTYGHNTFQIIHIHTTVINSGRAHTTQHRIYCGAGCSYNPGWCHSHPTVSEMT